MNNKTILKDAKKIGIETLEQLKDFEAREKRQSETLAETLKRYCRELGENTIKKLKYQADKERARETAKEWQRNAADSVQNWGELAEDLAKLEKLAKRLGLVQEFRENGIL